MQTLTFTQKLLRQRRFLSSLIPLLALFVGLGASQTALGAVILSGQAVTLNQGNGNNTYPKAAYDNSTLIDQKTGSTTTPKFDINTGVLVLNGGTLTTTENNGSVVSGGFIDYVINDPNFVAISNGIIPLTQTSNSAGVRTFSASAADIRVIEQILTSGNGYAISVSFRARYRNNGAGAFLNEIDGNVGNSLYNAFYDVIGARPVPNGVTLSNPNVIVNQGAGSITRTAATFNGVALIDQKPGSTTTPAFDINTGILTLKGGSITTTATGTSVVTSAVLNYTVLSSSNAQVAIGTLVLNPTGVASGGVRTYELTTGSVDLIGLIPSAAAGYKIAVSYQVTFENSAGGSPFTAIDNNGGGNYLAAFDVTGVRAPAPTVQANTILIAPNGGADVTFYFNSASSPQFSGADLSSPANGGTTYNVNNGQLLLNNTTVTTTSPDVVNVVLYYRTRLSTSTGGAYQALTLTQNSGSVTSDVKTFSLNPATASQPNLIATPAVISAGTYSVDVYYQANGTRNGTPFSIVDPPTGFYSASFTVVGTPIAQTIWTGGKNDNWFDVDNWSAGIPTATTNALVRDLGAGTQAPYPNIYAGVVARTTGGAFLYDNTAYPFAAARNLILGGTSQANRSIARLIVGRLKVYGDFTNTFASFIQRENTVVEFAGTDVPNVNGANQVITNGGFAAVEIGGTGNKDLTGLMEVSKSITFTGGILRTNISDPGGSLVILADRSPINNMNGAQLLGETDATYLRGFAKTTRQGVLVGETRTYGNMGMTLTFTGTNSPGNMEVTRNTVEAYAPVSGRFGIRRIFGVRPGDQTTNTAGLSADMVFRYRTSETMDLNGVNTRTPGNGSIPEPNLLIFVSSNAGGNFGIVGRDGPVDLVNKEVSKMGVRSFATFTLGDSENPLPVRLTAFDAKRVGTDALVTWETASELNSRGYEVQISTTGKEFRTLASVASAAPNTNRTTQYRYIDTEANKSGTRYYRLRQIDLDGKEAFFNPVAVSFTGKAIETALVAYPNPLNGNEQLHLTFQSANAGKGQISITDMTGRMVRQQPIDVTTGTSDLTVEKLGDLKMGMYLVRLTLPSGQVQNLKVVKQ